jgi:hypothetical protein
MEESKANYEGASMAKQSAPRPPLPLVQAFLLCREILRDVRTKETILIGPTCHIPASQFAANISFCTFLQLTEGHGRYHLALSLQNSQEEEVWRWESPQPLEHPHPLLPHQVAFHDLVMAVPRVGRYRFVLLANGEEIAQQALFLGPTEAFR